MRQVLVERPGVYEVVEAPDPRPGEGEVLLAMRSAGICGGDLALLDGRNALARYPTVLGHECVAQVVESTRARSGLGPGDHVAVYPTVSCDRCEACRAGHDNQCADVRVMGTSHPNGCFADLIVTPARQCVRISDDVASLYGALIEPLAVGWHVTSRAECRTGETAVLFGAGSVGLATVAVAAARGVRTLACVDRFPSRQGAATALGAGPLTTLAGDDLRAWLQDTVGTVDVVFDTVATRDTAAAAVASLRPGGRYVTVASGRPGQELCLAYDEVHRKELTLVGSRGYVRADFRQAARLLAEGRVDPRPLATATFPLDRFGDAVGALTRYADRYVKVLLEPSRPV